MCSTREVLNRPWPELCPPIDALEVLQVWIVHSCKMSMHFVRLEKSLTARLHLPKLLSTSLCCACCLTWFSNIWILLDCIWDWTRTKSCMYFMAFIVCRFTFCPLTTPCSLTRPLRALKLLLACEMNKNRISITKEYEVQTLNICWWMVTNLIAKYNDKVPSGQ